MTSAASDKADDSYKCRSAVKLGIPVVSIDYLHSCVDNGQLVDIDPFVVLGSTKKQLLSCGVIAGKYLSCSAVLSLLVTLLDEL